MVIDHAALLSNILMAMAYSSNNEEDDSSENDEERRQRLAQNAQQMAERRQPYNPAESLGDYNHTPLELQKGQSCADEYVGTVTQKSDPNTPTFNRRDIGNKCSGAPEETSRPERADGGARRTIELHSPRITSESPESWLRTCLEGTISTDCSTEAEDPNAQQDGAKQRTHNLTNPFASCQMERSPANTPHRCPGPWMHTPLRRANCTTCRNDAETLSPPIPITSREVEESRTNIPTRCLACAETVPSCKTQRPQGPQPTCTACRILKRICRWSDGASSHPSPGSNRDHDERKSTLCNPNRSQQEEHDELVQEHQNGFNKAGGDEQNALEQDKCASEQDGQNVYSIMDLTERLMRGSDDTDLSDREQAEWDTE
jgi:hypothetical protein